MRIFWIGVFWLFSGSALSVTDISNSRDYTGLTRFPGSVIVQYENIQEPDYRQVLGVLEKINGVLRPEKEQRLAGTLTQITYRIPENHNPQAAFDHFYTQIIGQKGVELFKCVGRACGSSNQWANNIFGYSRLYGVDSTQNFSSFKLDQNFISLYAVQRGNKRVYLRLEVLEQNSSAAKTAKPQLTSGKEVTDEAQDVRLLVDFLEANTEQVIWLVAYDTLSGSKEQQLERSQSRVEAFKARLITAGASPERIFTHAVGAFGEQGDTEGSQRLIVYSESRSD